MEQFVERAGCRIAYDLCGHGSPVLFIQGVGVHGVGWRPQVEVLAKHHSCISFDNRGMGRSVPAGSKVSVEQMANDALGILDSAGWESAHVVGHSLGGVVALQLALVARACVKSLTLMCTFADGRTAAPLSFRMMWLGMRTKVGTRKMRRNGFLRLILSPTAKIDPGMAERMAELFGHDLGDQPPIVGEQLSALRAANLAPRLGELAGLPTLVLGGVHDPISPPKVGRALASAIPSAKYVEFPDSSHGLPITHAEEVNRLLLEHFAAVDGA